jgi:hypothetical protein
LGVAFDALAFIIDTLDKLASSVGLGATITIPLVDFFDQALLWHDSAIM